MARRWPYGSPGDLLGDIGQNVARRYQLVEDEIHRTIEKLLPRAGDQRVAMSIGQLEERLRTFVEYREAVEEALKRVDPETLARQVVGRAQGEAAAMITRTLVDIGALEHFPRGGALGGLNLGTLTAGVAIELDTRNMYTALNRRILRQAQDTFQQITSDYAALAVAGVTTRKALRKRLLQEYTSRGIVAFEDQSGRNWSIDTYAEMATRTAATRAYREQSVASMESHGIELFTPIAGSASCEACGTWQGKIVSERHTGGSVVQVISMTTGSPVQVTVDGSLEQARAEGWGHPNCRCVLAPYIPGSGIDPTKFTTRDPEAEADRRRERELRREWRDARDSGDRQRMREARAELREVRDRIDSRKTTYATRNSRPIGTPVGPASITMEEYVNNVKELNLNIDPTKMAKFSSLTDDEIHAVGIYSGPGYSDLNGVARGEISAPIGGDWDRMGGFEKIRANLDSALSKSRFTTESRVMRSGRWSELEQITGFGLGGETGYRAPWNPSRMDPAQQAEYASTFVGKSVTPGGYVSTSVPLKSPKTSYVKAPYEPNNDVIYNVIVPEGTHGGVLGELNRRSSEREVLFPRGTSFDIVDAIVDPETFQLRLTVIVRN